MDGQNGRRIAERRRAAIGLADARPDALVVVLGSNDAYDRTPEQVRRDVADFLEVVAQIPCVRWVTVQEDFYVGDLGGASGRARTVNAVLHHEAVRRPNLGLADFGSVIDVNPTWHYGDLLHLDGNGDRALAGVIARSIDDCPRR
ncbi:MAG: hypothetical protein U5R31_04155 [Acidimicrobiia bacterium]|nr:hypothetical protein [Acidimicrobiia bacterium]